MVADGILPDGGIERPAPTIEVSPNSNKASEYGKRMTRMMRREQLREKGLREYESRAPILEVPTGRRQGESTAETVSRRATSYSSEKQRHRLFNFFRPKEEATPQQTQSRPYFSSNEGRRIVPNVPDYGVATNFRREQGNIGRRERPEASERPQDRSYRVTQPESVFRDSSKNVPPQEPPRRTRVLDRSRGSTTPESSFNPTSVLRNLQENNPPEGLFRRPAKESGDNSPKNFSRPLPLPDEPVVTASTETEPITFTFGEDEDDPSKKDSSEFIIPPEKPAPAEPITFNFEEDDDAEDDSFDFDNLDLSIPSFEDGEEAQPKPNTATPSEEAAPEVTPEPANAAPIVPRMRMHIHERPSVSMLRKPASERSFASKDPVYNPYTNSSIYHAQYRDPEDIDTGIDSPQTV